MLESHILECSVDVKYPQLFQFPNLYYFSSLGGGGGGGEEGRHIFFFAFNRKQSIVTAVA